MNRHRPAVRRSHHVLPLGVEILWEAFIPDLSLHDTLAQAAFCSFNGYLFKKVGGGLPSGLRSAGSSGYGPRAAPMGFGIGSAELSSSSHRNLSQRLGSFRWLRMR